MAFLIARDLGTQLIMSYCLQLRLQQSSEAIYVKFATPCNKKKDNCLVYLNQKKDLVLDFIHFKVADSDTRP